jgi:hypothetical protein
MDYCILCKELVDGRYVVDITDKKVGNSVRASVCRYCFNKFLESSQNAGFFNISRFANWTKEKIRGM